MLTCIAPFDYEAKLAFLVGGAAELSLYLRLASSMALTAADLAAMTATLALLVSHPALAWVACMLVLPALGVVVSVLTLVGVVVLYWGLQMVRTRRWTLVCGGVLAGS